MFSDGNYINTGQYSIHSLYLALINNGRVERNKTLWRLKIPLKNHVIYA
jgi:hypothetical protein